MTLKNLIFYQLHNKLNGGCMDVSARHIRLNSLYGAHNYLPLPIVIKRARGPWVWDVNGKRYLDCLSAYSALNQGHGHPRLVRVARHQINRLTLTSRAFLNDQSGLFFRELAKLCGKDKVLPMNTGAEAVETAIKTARKWGYTKKGVGPDKAEIVVFKNNFHGRTTTIIGFSTEDQYQQGFGPFTPGFRIVPYDDVEAMRRAINENTVAVLVEPIQGEAGIILPRKGFLAAIRETCTESNVLMIADEIQTGLGRTGKMFACDHERVVPDIYVLGKALGGGFYPISAVAANDDILDIFRPGDHGSTFGGNPLACAIGREAIKILVEEKLPERALRLGKYFMGKLSQINSAHIKEVRGRGFLIGIELKQDSGPARPFCEKLMKVGVLTKETHERVIRFAPPLVIKRREIDWALKRIERVLAA